MTADPFAEPMSATCRHCARPLSKLDAGWVDEDGLLACVKAPVSALAESFTAPVLHEPMPPGLRGAPPPMTTAGTLTPCRETVPLHYDDDLSCDLAGSHQWHHDPLGIWWTTSVPGPEKPAGAPS